jgi:phosphoglucosamine mutase
VLGGARCVIGRDTRRSGPLLEAALAAGLASEGVDVVLLGVVPTPAVAHASAALGVPGAVISASHNPFADNGIKLFAPGGRKLTDDVEEAIEALLAPGALTGTRPVGAAVGTIAGDEEALVARWTESLVASVDGRLGLRDVLDSAHGAAAAVAPGVLEALGAVVVVLGAEPDGVNINDGVGATAPAALAAAVLAHDADVGIALDGDADRLIAVDAGGGIVDGDHLMAILAIDRHARGRLTAATEVCTVMSNLGFRLGMDRAGITVVETAVGDRYVLEAMAATGATLGGEQSGHLILADHATTGDGLLSAIQLLDVVVRDGRPLAEIAAEAMTSLPQVLRNVRVQGDAATVVAAVADEVAAAEARLGGAGRVLLRPSGTEPLVRVMVEAETAERADVEAARLVAAVEAHT